MKIDFTLNGTPVTLETEPVKRLLDVLRDDFDMKGTKEGCGEGECGACSIFIDDRLANSCLIPAAQAEGAKIITIDGIRNTEAGKLITEAYAEAHAVQCGFCTPGMIMASLALLKVNPDPDEQAVREGISGNICRCTGYDMIIDAVQLAAKRAKERGLSW